MELAGNRGLANTHETETVSAENNLSQNVTTSDASSKIIRKSLSEIGVVHLTPLATPAGREEGMAFSASRDGIASSSFCSSSKATQMDSRSVAAPRN